jgi:Tfp pilus assembly protein PilN
MIKVNLLDSVTERASSASVVEEKVANPRTRMWLVVGACFALMALVMVFDYVSAAAARVRVQAELERQQQIAAQMAAINKEQADLEKKLQNIKTRIDAIKRLRASQQGPVALLSDINLRLPADPAFRLDSVEQKNGELTIEGMSSDETAVTKFGRSLEFSDGLFLNVSIETERKEFEVNPADYPDDGRGPFDMTTKPEAIKFKIKCKYGPTAPPPAPPQPQKAANGPQVAPAPQVAQK